MTDEQNKAVAEYERCAARLKKAITFREGGQGAEAAYSQAYGQMVRLGLARPIRRKYR